MDWSMSWLFCCLIQIGCSPPLTPHSVLRAATFHPVSPHTYWHPRQNITHLILFIMLQFKSQDWPCWKKNIFRDPVQTLTPNSILIGNFCLWRKATVHKVPMQTDWNFHSFHHSAYYSSSTYMVQPVNVEKEVQEVLCFLSLGIFSTHWVWSYDLVPQQIQSAALLELHLKIKTKDFFISF